jgi:pre-rRNA-processing protein TSR4
MWSGGEDFSDQGEPVRLYQPILYGRKPSVEDLTCSFVGGEKAAAETPACALCHEPLKLLLQLFVPKFPAANQEPVDRTLQVFACNSAACMRGIFAGDKFSQGGGGVVVCRRLAMAPSVPTPKPMTVPKPAAAQESPWDADDGENDWTIDGAAEGDMQDLESKLAAMQTTKPVSKVSSAPPKKSKPKTNGFSCYKLVTLQERPDPRAEGMDEDDVGFSGSDAKIQEMLSRYMAEEDDEDILAALKGSSGSGGGSGGGRVERDERLSPEDRAMLTYSDRLKRSPQQVVRYALGGCPLWSM